ncbi:MAG: nicotinate-nucleotide adenylyltransferase [Gammaproteobacteria bacterium]|jgi:nicotinate-nucleotide adenylyltransferase
MLGIFGGTFDPIHYGHLSAAWQVYQTLNLTQLRFMPCNHPPHRSAAIANATHRVNMLKLAIKDIPEFVIDDRELKSNDISYSVNSLKQIRQEIGNTPLCFILGLDAFNQIHTWHEPFEIIKLAHIIVLGRPDHNLNQTDMINDLMQHQIDNPEKLKMQNAGFIYFEQNTLLDISATQIRNMLIQGISPKFLLPDDVLDYIEHEGLYSSV